MKLTKSNLRQMILQEIKISIGSFLEEADLGDPDEDIGGGNVVTQADIGSNATVAGISEDGASEESPKYGISSFIAGLENLAMFFGEGSEEMGALDPIITDFKGKMEGPGNEILMQDPEWQKQ